MWIEAQRLGSRQGKLVTGEMVAEIVNRLKKQDPLGHATVRQRLSGISKTGSGSHEAFERPVTSTEKSDFDAQLSESHRPSLDMVLLLADFEMLRTRANLLVEEERKRILLEVSTFLTCWSTMNTCSVSIAFKQLQSLPKVFCLENQ